MPTVPSPRVAWGRVREGGDAPDNSNSTHRPETQLNQHPKPYEPRNKPARLPEDKRAR